MTEKEAIQWCQDNNVKVLFNKNIVIILLGYISAADITFVKAVERFIKECLPLIKDYEKIYKEKVQADILNRQNKTK